MKRLFCILATICSALLISSCIYDDPEQEYEIQLGETIPDFSVTMNDGSIVTGASLRKGVSLIMFFHSECPDCQATLPSVQRIYDEYKDKGVSFALISRAQEASLIEPYWKEQGYTMLYSGQPDRSIYLLFATSRVPRVYICKNGKVMSRYTDDPIPTYEELLSDIEGSLD